MNSVHVGAGEGERIQHPLGDEVTFLVRGAQTGGTLTIFETEVAPGKGPPLHTHASEEEGLYVLEGEVRFRSRDEIWSGGVGSFLFVPRGVPHCFQNAGDGPLRLLIAFTPSGMERFFEAFDAAEDPDPDVWRTIGAEVGMEVVGPPLAESHPA